MSKNDEFCIKNEEFCIKNEEICIKNEEFCIKNEEFCIEMMKSAGIPHDRFRSAMEYVFDVYLCIYMPAIDRSMIAGTPRTRRHTGVAVCRVVGGAH